MEQNLSLPIDRLAQVLSVPRDDAMMIVAELPPAGAIYEIVHRSGGTANDTWRTAHVLAIPPGAVVPKILNRTALSNRGIAIAAAGKYRPGNATGRDAAEARAAEVITLLKLATPAMIEEARSFRDQRDQQRDANAARRKERDAALEAEQRQRQKQFNQKHERWLALEVPPARERITRQYAAELRYVSDFEQFFSTLDPDERQWYGVYFQVWRESRKAPYTWTAIVGAISAPMPRHPRPGVLLRLLSDERGKLVADRAWFENFPTEGIARGNRIEFRAHSLGSLWTWDENHGVAWRDISDVRVTDENALDALREAEKMISVTQLVRERHWRKDLIFAHLGTPTEIPSLKYKNHCGRYYRLGRVVEIERDLRERGLFSPRRKTATTTQGGP